MATETLARAPGLADIEACPLGRALRGFREEQSNRPKVDWSRIPLYQFYEAHARQLAQLRCPREAIRAEKQLERARRSGIAMRQGRRS